MKDETQSLYRRFFDRSPLGCELISEAVIHGQDACHWLIYIKLLLPVARIAE